MSEYEKEKQATPALAGAAGKIARLRKMHKEFEKEKDVQNVLRVKALIAYYNGMLPSIIIQCYEINEKTLKNWVERFENEESPGDLPRSGYPSKLPKEKREKILQNLIAIFLLSFFFLISALSIRGMHTTVDEPLHYEYGMSILNGNATRYGDSLMPVSAWNALPAKIGSYLPDGKIKEYLKKEITARLMTTLFSLAVAALVFHWTRKLYGFVPAIVSLALYVLDPNIIAHSPLVTTDIYATGAIAFSTYWLWKFVNSHKWQDGLWLALALGFAQLTKYTSIALYPLFAVALLVSDLPAMAEKIRAKGKTALLAEAERYVQYLLVGMSVGILVINVGFLFNRTFMPLKDYEFQSEPFKFLQSKVNFIVPTPYPFLFGLDWTMHDERIRYGAIYLLGKTQVEGFKGYYVVASALKTPIATQIVVWVALIGYFVNKKWKGRFLQNEWLLLLPVAFYAIYFNFFYNTQIGIRHYLVIFPLLYVFTGSLFRGWYAFTRVQKIRTGVLGLYLAASTLFHYPNYIAYFNEIIQDQRMEYKYLADSNIEWGQDVNTLNYYLASRAQLVYEMPQTPYLLRRNRTFYVSVNDLVGITSTNPPDAYAWVTKNFEPTGMIAPSYLLFEITPEQMQQLCDTTNYCQ